jgi:hypothetical protein
MERFEDPLEVWVDPHGRPDALNRAQSLLKFRRDCKDVDGGWSLEEKSAGDLVGRCELRAVESVIAEDALVNLSRPGRPWNFEPEVRWALKKRYREGSYGLVQLTVRRGGEEGNN